MKIPLNGHKLSFDCRFYILHTPWLRSSASLCVVQKWFDLLNITNDIYLQKANICLESGKISDFHGQRVMRWRFSVCMYFAKLDQLIVI